MSDQAWKVTRIAVAIGFAALIARTDNWRAAALVVAAGAAIAATRIRYATWAATALLAVFAALGVAGHPIGSYRRPPAATVKAEPAQKHHRRKRRAKRDARSAETGRRRSRERDARSAKQGPANHRRRSRRS